VRVSKDGRWFLPCRHASRRAQERAPQHEVRIISQALRIGICSGTIASGTAMTKHGHRVRGKRIPCSSLWRAEKSLFGSQKSLLSRGTRNLPVTF
jgi:hypothetical protein